MADNTPQAWIEAVIVSEDERFDLNWNDTVLSSEPIDGDDQTWGLVVLRRPL